MQVLDKVTKKDCQETGYRRVCQVIRVEPVYVFQQIAHPTCVCADDCLVGFTKEPDHDGGITSEMMARASQGGYCPAPKKGARDSNISGLCDIAKEPTQTPGRCTICGGKPEAPRCSLIGGAHGCPNEHAICDEGEDCGNITTTNCPICLPKSAYPDKGGFTAEDK